MVASKPNPGQTNFGPFTCYPWEIPGYLHANFDIPNARARDYCAKYSPAELLHAIREVKRNARIIAGRDLDAAFRAALEAHRAEAALQAKPTQPAKP